jgi:hypothetical protein
MVFTKPVVLVNPFFLGGLAPGELVMILAFFLRIALGLFE